MSVNPTPAFAAGALVAIGGVYGYVKTRSLPSIVAGLGVGALYLWSADKIASGQPNGLEGALGASALLFLSSAPRVAKAFVPKVLGLASAIVGLYYGNVYYNLKA